MAQYPCGARSSARSVYDHSSLPQQRVHRDRCAPLVVLAILHQQKASKQLYKCAAS